MLGDSSGRRRRLEDAALDRQAQPPHSALGYAQKLLRTGTVNVTSF
jgi:hypothetical protein